MFANLIPRSLSRRGLLLWHRDAGAFASPLLLVLLLTGSGLVFYDTARTLLNGAFGDRVPVVAPPTEEALAVSAPDGAMLLRVQAVFPAARLVFYNPPRQGAGIHIFRLKQPCELHPNGRSFVHTGPTGRVVGEVDACAMPPGERTAHVMYPLHSGKTGSAIYRLVAFLGAMALAGLSLSGAISYLKKLRRVYAQ